MKYIIALLLTFGAFAAQATTPTKRISLDIGRPENTFVLGPISRGSSEYIDCALYVRGTAYPTNDLSGSLWYSVANTSTTGVSISTVDADVINGHVYIQMSVTDSLGLSTTEADYPITYYASVVLTNATQTHVFDVGTLVLRWDAATASAGSATLSNGAQPTYFTALTDTPSSYTGQGGKVVSVNTGGTALEFTTAGSGSGDLTEVQVSGSILTVASGTGPIPIVGLTTAAVQAAQITYTAATNLILSGTEFSLDGSGVASLALADSALQSYTETDPIAILPDGTRSMTADLQIGTNKVQDVTGIHFVPTNSAVSSVEGNVYWDETDITLALRSDIADAIMQVGQEFWMRAKKDAGETISNGDAVYISGASGERPKVARADSVTNSHVVGLATHTWTSNDGWVTMEGLVRDLDTSSYSDGDELFVSATPGGLTNVSQFVGQGSVATVTRSHASAGHVFVAIVHSELEPAWNAVSNTVTANALLGSTALQTESDTLATVLARGNDANGLAATNILEVKFGSGGVEWGKIVSSAGSLKIHAGDNARAIDLTTQYNLTVGATPVVGWDTGRLLIVDDATSGQQAVGWSVLTNQIALLAPAGGGVTPAFTNVSSLSYNVADLSGIDVNQGLVWNSVSGSFTNSSGTLLVAPASVSAINATTWSVVYSDGSTTGNLKSLALPTAGKVLTGNGVSAAPTWETPAAAGESWTDRGDEAGWDFLQSDLTTDNTWRDMDLSSIIGTNQATVFLRVSITETVGRSIQFRENGNTTTVNASVCVVPVSSQNIQYDINVRTDTSGIIEYKASNVAWSQIAISAKGWIK